MKYPVFIEPGNDDGVLLDAKAVKGGFVVVETLSDLNTLLLTNSGSVVNGSHAYVGAENKTYVYNSDGNEWSESSVDVDIDDLLQRITETENSISNINDKINKNVVNNLSITTSGDTVNVNTSTINILNNSTATDSDALPLATNSNAGLMSQSDYQTLYNINSRIENLEGTTTRLLYLLKDTLKEIEYNGETYSPAFYINDFLYQVKNNNTEIHKIFNGILLDFTFVGRDLISLPTPAVYNIEFTSGGNNYTALEFTTTRILYKTNETQDVAYNGTNWLNSFRTVTFTGGKDINNTSLITWLQNNSSSLSCSYNISGATCNIKGITYTFSNFTVGSTITREVSANNINAFVTSIYDRNGQQLYFPPFRGIAVVIDGTFHIWHYYPNEDGGVVIGWKDDGVDTVSQFTNSSSGIILGSETDGQIYAESNGTGSVVGWTSLKNRVTNVENNKAPKDLASDNNAGLMSASLYTKLNNLGLANDSTNGLMSSSQYTKLSGIETGAQVNILEGIKSNTTLLTPDENKLVEIKAGNNILFTNDSTNDIIINATIPDPVTIDDELSSSSINPVENRVITNALNDKVDKISGKGLSTEDFTTAEKTKLGTVETNANYYILPSDVPHDSNYHHTDNNFTNALKTKLDNIASDAQANVIETIQKNGTALSVSNKTVNITVPTQASDINALPNTTKYASNLSASIDNQTFVITLQLKDQDGNNLGSAQTIDLPLESLISSANYYDTYTYDGTTYTDVIVMIFSTGQTIIIPVADLVQGLQREITVNNKLESDLIDDTNQTNLFVTITEKNTWNAKQDTMSAGTGITLNGTTISINKRDIINNTYSLPTASSTSVDFINLKDSSNATLYRKKEITIEDQYGDLVTSYSYEKILSQRDKTELQNNIDTVSGNLSLTNTRVTNLENTKVSKTGNETINGVKTFIDRPIGIKENTRVPAEFTQVEYIQTNGSQYISLGTLTNPLKIELEWTPTQTTGQQMITGFGWGYNQMLLTVYDGEIGQFSNNYTKISATTGTPYEISYSSIENTLKINGISYTNEADTSTTGTFNIFGTTSHYAYGRLSYLKVYNLISNALIYDLVPCYANQSVTLNGTTYASGTIGLYDNVNDEFYINEGTGAFTKGDDVILRQEFALKGDLTNIITNPQEEATEQLSKIEIDGTVYQISVEGQGLILLWTNENYNSNFLSQTINLTLTNYDGVIIVLSDDTGVAHQSSFLYLRDNLPYRATISSEGFLTYRDITVTNFGVVFGNALVSSTYNSTPTTNNSYCIPYQIYGVRFAAGSGSGDGSNVIGNPTGIATETLNKISINNIIYDIPQAITVDDFLSLTSSNPVQNSVITNTLNTKVSKTGNETIDGQKTFIKIPKVDGVRLPIEFTEVEYIENQNNAYIELDYIPNSNSVVEIKFNPSSVVSDLSSPCMIFGSANNFNSNSFEFALSGYGFSTYGTEYVTNLGVNIENKDYKLVKDKNLTYIDDVLKATQSTASFVTPYKMQLFSSHRTGGTLVSGVPTRLYYVTISENNQVLYNLIPCYTNQQVTNNGTTYNENTIGLYDIVNDKFYVNIGSGQLIKGTDVLNKGDVALLSQIPTIEINNGQATTEQLNQLNINGINYAVDINTATELPTANSTSIDFVNIIDNTIESNDGQLYRKRISQYWDETTLEGMTWRFNFSTLYNPGPAGNFNYNITFESNGQTFNSLQGILESSGYNYGLLNYGNQNVVYYSSGWTNQNYKTIKITGGNDVTNQNLITYLTTYATIIEYAPPIYDYVSIQDKIDTTNKLASDLIDDTNQTNKFVSTSDITNWNAKSTVVGNPTGETTDTLTKLSIDGVNYEIQSGSSGMTNPMTAQNDIIIGGVDGVPTALPKGSNGQVLQINSSGNIEWGNASSGGGMSNPMTTAGDIIVGGTSGTPTRLGIGTNGQVLTSNGTTASWQTPSGGGGGTNVIANPTLLGNEDYLTGITIGSTNYILSTTSVVD